MPPQMTHFIEKFNHLNGKNVVGISREAMAVLMLYDWPGNVRELENAKASSDQKQPLVHVYDSMTVSSDLEFWSKRVQALSGQISYFGIGVLFHHLFQQFHINFFPDGLFANLGIRTTDFW
jgi:transcriptional regulator of aromatic amino acid metabolism